MFADIAAELLRVSDPNPAMRWKGFRSILLVLACMAFLISGCNHAPVQAPSMPNSPFQTNAKHYEREQILESISGTIKNNSPSTIEVIPVDEFFVYARLLRRGWVSLRHCTRCAGPSEIYQPFIIERDQAVPVDIRAVAANYMLHLIPDSSFSAYLIGANYTSLSGEEDERFYVMYSNEFQIGKPANPPLFIRITNLESSIPLTRVSNESSSSIWIRPACSPPTRSEQAGFVPRPGRSPWATLQRRTSWSTWEVIQPRRPDCTRMIAPIEIPAQTVQTMELWEGIDFDWEALEPGWYRWHVVYFWEGPEIGFGVDYHWFTEEFRIGK